MPERTTYPASLPTVTELAVDNRHSILFTSHNMTMLVVVLRRPLILIVNVLYAYVLRLCTATETSFVRRVRGFQKATVIGSGTRIGVTTSESWSVTGGKCSSPSHYGAVKVRVMSRVSADDRRTVIGMVQ